MTLKGWLFSLLGSDWFSLLLSLLDDWRSWWGHLLGSWCTFFKHNLSLCHFGSFNFFFLTFHLLLSQVKLLARLGSNQVTHHFIDFLELSAPTGRLHDLASFRQPKELPIRLDLANSIFDCILILKSTFDCLHQDIFQILRHTRLSGELDMGNNRFRDKL